jgi:hypothetical protein
VKRASLAAFCLACSAAGAGLFACAGILGIKEVSVESDGGVPDLAPDAAPSLNCPLGCLPPPPPGWIGPSAVFAGPGESKPSGCPATYTVKEVDGHLGLRSSPAKCTCGAPTVVGVSCKLEVEVFDSADCEAITGSGPLEVRVATSPCFALGNISAFEVRKVVPATTGTCTYPNPVKEIPALTFDRVDIACGLPQGGSCATRPDCTAAPVPDAPFTRVCLHAPGDISCPSVDYAVRFIAYETLEDTRSCDLTGCGNAPSADTCSKTFGYETAAQCADGGTGVYNRLPDTCIQGGNASLNLRGIRPTSTCPPPTATAVGTASSTGGVTTFCCNR